MTAGLDIIDILDFTQGAVEVESGGQGLSVLKQHYLKAARDNDFRVDAVYFSGEFPSVYFKKVPDFQPEVLREILEVQRKIWNQDKVPFLYVESPLEIRVYNCFEKPRKTENEISELLLLKSEKRVEQDLKELERVFHKISIETGNFWKQDEYALKVKNDTRVDRALIESLKETRRILHKQGKGLPLEVIHDLLLRSLFLLYLEDRGATDAELYEGHKDYFEVLADLESTYRVFGKLEKSFNGNLSPVTEKEREMVTPGHLGEIRNGFWSGRTLFFGWRFFDFKIIPIQLISEIYEHFLTEEIGTAKKNASGTFYTPHPLAEFVLNEVLPHAADGDNKSNLKILDPTCGSGIFLVESLNRLLDRWEMANSKKELTFEVVSQIATDNIFGIEKQKEAIKVAAFSIYLAMLDRLEPKTLWQNKRFPYLIHDPEIKDEKKQGKNLFRMSSLDSGPFEDIGYDIVVGNPPFGGRKVEKDVRAYLAKEGFGNETVEAFLHRATQLCPEGKIALISTSKVLFNTGSNHQNFRRFLFNDCYVDKVYNFSILRRVPQNRGRNLFSSTVRPVSVFIYSKQWPEQPSETLMYCAPSTAIKNRIIDGIAIDPTDVKYLPREECQKPDTKIWKVAMWGTERDFGLVQRFLKMPSLAQFIDMKRWEKGVGFRLPSTLSEPKPDEEIKKLPYLDARKVSRYYTLKENTGKVDYDLFKRFGNKLVYSNPHILIKEGQKNRRFCASFSDFDCSFQDSVYAIQSNEEGSLKLLTAYLNSQLAFYLMFLTTADWGVERERVKPNEILDLPDLCFSLPEETKQKIAGHVDEIIQIRKNEFIHVEPKIAAIEQKIETSLWEALDLSDTDKVLIEDLLEYQLDSFQSGQKSKAYRPCNLDDSRAYAQHLCKTINSFLGYSDELSVWATIFDVSVSTPLNVVVLHLEKEKKSGTIEELQSGEINAILKELEQYAYQEHSESIYYRKFFRYYNYDVVYILKPNEKHCWTRSLGINDADEIILEILTSEYEEENQA
jgi:hypothetical protein